MNGWPHAAAKQAITNNAVVIAILQLNGVADGLVIACTVAVYYGLVSSYEFHLHPKSFKRI